MSSFQLKTGVNTQVHTDNQYIFFNTLLLTKLLLFIYNMKINREHNKTVKNTNKYATEKRKINFVEQ